MPNASTPCDDDEVWLSRKFLNRVPQWAFRWPGVSFVVVLLVVSGTVAPQSSLAQGASKSSSPRNSVTLKRSCPEGSGFCFSYPASWTMLSQDPAIVAPEQTLDRELWDEVTVAAVVPPPAGNQPAMSIDQVIATAMANMKASGHNPATLQRQQRTVAGNPAQMIRIRYRDEPNGRDWIEQLVFIEGPDQQIYSVALKGRPGTISRLQPAFDAIVRSWKLESAENSGPEPSSSGKPATDAPHN